MQRVGSFLTREESSGTAFGIMTYTIGDRQVRQPESCLTSSGTSVHEEECHLTTWGRKWQCAGFRWTTPGRQVATKKCLMQRWDRRWQRSGCHVAALRMSADGPGMYSGEAWVRLVLRFRRRAPGTHVRMRRVPPLCPRARHGSAQARTRTRTDSGAVLQVAAESRPPPSAARPPHRGRSGIRETDTYAEGAPYRSGDGGSLSNRRL